MKFMSRMSYGPLPKLGHLFFKKDKPSDKNVLNLWVKNGERGYWLSRSAWSLYIITKYRMQLSKKKS